MQQGDLDGARRLGRLAGTLSITFIIMGIIIIIVAVTVNFAGEAQRHPSSLGVGTTEGCGPAPRDRGGGGEKGSQGMWDLSSLTRDQTHAPCIGSMES